MQLTEKRDIHFKSASGKNEVAGYFFESKEVKPWCILQIVHGMTEYIERYAEFAEFMNANGIIVCGNDHLGHGKTAKDEKEYGHFVEYGGRNFVLRDIWEMNRLAKEAYPGLPLVMLGHSMGSFFARRYAADWPNTIDGLIISGTSGPVKGSGLGAVIAKLIGKLRGSGYKSKLLYKMALGSYLKRVESPKTIYDWISRDDDIVQKYAADPLCTFSFTANGYYELFNGLKDVSSLKWAQRIRKNMPVFLFSGDADPVGQYGKGVMKVYEWLKEAGVETLEVKLYPDGRHEMLNETNRAEVYKDVLSFIETHLKK